MCIYIYMYMVVSQNRGPQNTIILIMGTPKMVPPILGNPPYLSTYRYADKPLSSQQSSCADQIKLTKAFGDYSVTLLSREVVKGLGFRGLGFRV